MAMMMLQSQCVIIDHVLSTQYKVRRYCLPLIRAPTLSIRESVQMGVAHRWNYPRIVRGEAPRWDTYSHVEFCIHRHLRALNGGETRNASRNL